MAESLWLSKVRYGIQLCGKIRTKESDPLNKDMKRLQQLQNRMTIKKFGDRTSSSQLVQKINFLLINQLNCQIKLVEAWKSQNLKSYPNKLEPQNTRLSDTRGSRNGNVIESGRSRLVHNSFYGDCSRAWNQCPINIKQSKTLAEAEKFIKIYAKSIPI